jgi:hypothetical protein
MPSAVDRTALWSSSNPISILNVRQRNAFRYGFEFVDSNSAHEIIRQISRFGRRPSPGNRLMDIDMKSLSFSGA